MGLRGASSEHSFSVSLILPLSPCEQLANARHNSECGVGAWETLRGRWVAAAEGDRAPCRGSERFFSEISPAAARES
jgi:hypothetical protein